MKRLKQLQPFYGLSAIPLTLLASAPIASAPIASALLTSVLLAVPTIAQAQDLLLPEAEFAGEDLEGIGEGPDRILLELRSGENLLERPTDPNAVELKNIYEITLEEALELAEVNSLPIQIRRLEIERQGLLLNQQRATLYPSLSLGGNALRNQTDVDTDTITSTGISRDSFSNTGTSLVNGTVRMDYSLYQPGRRASIKAAELELERLNLLLGQDLAQLRLDVADDYYQLQQADQRLRIAEGAVQTAEESLEDAQALERARIVPRFSVLQAEVQLSNQQQVAVQQRANQRQAQRQLAQRLSLPDGTNIVAVDRVEKVGEWPLGLAESVVLAFGNRSELDQRLLEIEISDRQKQVGRAGVRPTLGLYAQYGPERSFTDRDASAASATATTSAGNSDSITTVYEFGLNLTWTFFDGGAARAAGKQEAVNAQIAATQFANDRLLIRQAVENAFYDLEANRQNIQTASKGVEQARESLRIARLRFQAGIGVQLDVINAERDLVDAESNLVTATIGFNQALFAMQRAVGVTSEELVDLSPESRAPDQFRAQLRSQGADHGKIGPSVEGISAAIRSTPSPLVGENPFLPGNLEKFDEEFSMGRSNPEHWPDR